MRAANPFATPCRPCKVLILPPAPRSTQETMIGRNTPPGSAGHAAAGRLARQHPRDPQAAALPRRSRFCRDLSVDRSHHPAGHGQPEPIALAAGISLAALQGRENRLPLNLGSPRPGLGWRSGTTPPTPAVDGKKPAKSKSRSPSQSTSAARSRIIALMIGLGGRSPRSTECSATDANRETHPLGARPDNRSGQPTFRQKKAAPSGETPEEERCPSETTTSRPIRWPPSSS